MKHLPAIDGLRAVAVLAVVAYHAGLPVPAGFVGVDVFFVISGYVITRMLLAEPQIDLLAFYARRVRRILPALVLVVAVTLVASWALLASGPQLAVTRSAMAAMAMVANLYFQGSTGGYFDPEADELPLLHLWSLGVEEQFYLLWPLLLIAFRRRPWVIVALAVASFALALRWVESDQEAAFYQMPARFWELAIGGLVAMLPVTRLGPMAAIVGLGALTLGVASLPPTFPGIGAALPVFGAALVLYAIHGGTRIAPLEWRPVRYVGLISYSLYLWHWPLLALNRAVSFEPPTLTQNLALCAAAFVLAALSYHLVEVPFRKTNAPKVRAIAFGLAACALLAGCAAAVGATTPRATTWDAEDFPKLAAECHAQRTDPAKLPPASCGDGDVVLWGDSHAFAWRPFAESFGQVYQMSRAGCPPSLGRSSIGLCAQYSALAVERAKRGKVVILGARWSMYHGNGRISPVESDVASVLDALDGVPRVIVIGPLPVMRYEPPKCIVRERADLCGVTRASFDRESAPIRKILRGVVARYPNAEYVDPADYFCTPTECPLMKDGRSLYWDDDHIAASAAAAFARR